MGDRGAAVGAVDGGGFDGAVAGGAVSDSECRGCWGDVCCLWGGSAEDSVGDVDGLGDVVLADAVGHEEAFDPGDDHGDAGPREQKVDDAGGVAAEIEVMDADAAEEESEKDADGLVLAGALVFGVEPGALLLGHVGGVDGVGDLHEFVPLEDDKEMYAEGRRDVPRGSAVFGVCSATRRIGVRR
jgi:hypothetical protein